MDKQLKVGILFDFKGGPYGGGNQFLKALADGLDAARAYASSPQIADVVIANANPGNIKNILSYVMTRKNTCKKQGLVLRVDGPISLIRENAKWSDWIIGASINNFADGIIFQSKWSREKNKELISIKPNFETVIYNAPNQKVFRAKNRGNHLRDEVIKLIAVSWSANEKKGFSTYRYLDDHLDTARYQMTFIGNSPITFKNIRQLPPMSSDRLSQELQEHDIYVTASENDPCSNALIEALAMGLPAVARNSGGHPELVRKGGALFDDNKDVLPTIDLVSNNLGDYRCGIPVFSLSATTDQYLTFCEKIFSYVNKGSNKPKNGRCLAKKKAVALGYCNRLIH